MPLLSETPLPLLRPQQMCLRARSSVQKGPIRAFQTLSQPFTCPTRPQSKSFPSRGGREKARSKDFLEGPLPRYRGSGGSQG
mgnify:CR=1 FL=1